MGGATVRFLPQEKQRLRPLTALGDVNPTIIDDDFAFDSDVASAAFKNMRDALATALVAGQDYPSFEGSHLIKAMGWGNGFNGIQRYRPESLRIDIRPETAFLMPELIQIPDRSDKAHWLDKLVPCYRALDQERSADGIERHPYRNLAIVYQASPEFRKLVNELRRSLGRTGFGDRITYFPGDAFVGSDYALYKNVSELFFKHRAVAFVGHLKEPDGECGSGWMMTENEYLKLDYVAEVLGIRKEHGRLGVTPQEKGSPMPDVLFSACCSGATSDAKFFYPEVFTLAGVRYFIGASMDLIFPDMNACLDHLLMLLSEFFSRWFAGGEDCVRHLYDSKAICGFPLVSSLYQIYTSRVHHQTSQDLDQSRRDRWSPPVPRAPDPLVSSIRRGDSLGEYLIGDEAWSDVYGRFFWARVVNSADDVLVQILTDGWQGEPDLQATIGSAICKIQDAGLGPNHLVPTAAKRLPWRRVKNKLSDFYTVIYEGVERSEVSHWRPFRRFLHEQPDRQSRAYFDMLLKAGSQMAQLVAELHQRRLLHGNIDFDSILIRRGDEDQGVEVILKDMWVREALPGRRTPERFGAPLEEEGQDRDAMVKADCYALGVLLFESATGTPFDAEQFAGDAGKYGGTDRATSRIAYRPSVRQALKRDVGSDIAQQVPDALELIIADCLKPSADVRPTSAATAERLKFAADIGGNYVHDVIAQLESYVRAGRRLFCLYCDDVDEAEALMLALSPSTSDARSPYHLLVAEEDVGLRDPQQANRIIVPWTGADTVHGIMRQVAVENSTSPPATVTPDEVAVFNAAVILQNFLDQLAALRGLGRQAVLLIRGGTWWSELYGIERQFRIFHDYPSESPVIVIADQGIKLDVDIERLFVRLGVPPAAPSRLFDTVKQFSHDERIPIDDVSNEMAVALSIRMSPCTTRQAQMALRVAALERGKLDERVIDILNEERARLFLQLGTASYTPPGRLAPPDHVGIKRDHWRLIRRAIHQVPPRGSSPFRLGAQRVLVSGRPGTGKTTMAETLASWRGCPLIRIDAASCLRSNLGESEAALRYTLDAADGMHFAVVLLDDVDRFFHPAVMQDRPDSSTTGLVATMTRMSSIMLNWWDNAVKRIPGMLAVMTATDLSLLPAQWKRRQDLRFELSRPVGPDEREIREAIFRAVFRRHGLAKLAPNAEFVAWLAKETDRAPTRPPVLSPIARRAPGTALSDLRVDLSDAASIENWVSESILLHDHQVDPATPEFWRAAVTE